MEVQGRRNDKFATSSRSTSQHHMECSDSAWPIFMGNVKVTSDTLCKADTNSNAVLQVKIRGMRIELSEIESVLSKAPAVTAAAVKVVRHSQTQQDHIIAYTTPRDAPTKPMLAFAQRRLPVHMVPVLVVPMAAHPVLPNGKVDMSALPEPNWQLLAQDESFQAPQTRMEKLVASVWEAVLGIKDAGLQADFFKVDKSSLS